MKGTRRANLLIVIQNPYNQLFTLFIHIYAGFLDSSYQALSTIMRSWREKFRTAYLGQIHHSARCFYVSVLAFEYSGVDLLERRTFFGVPPPAAVHEAVDGIGATQRLRQVHLTRS